MVKDDEHAPVTSAPEETKKGSEQLPFLPKEFFLELLDLPSCKLTGRCDGCGKCG